MTPEAQFVWFAVILVAAVGIVLLILLIGMALFGVLATLCELKGAKLKEKNCGGV